MVPIISIVGKSKSGKTTLIERLVLELKSRGYKVATIKHTTHPVATDKPGKDSWRHIQAGSEATAISSPQGIVLFKPVKNEASIEQVVRLLDGAYDIVIVEGFKQSNAPKIEVHRRQLGTPLSKVENLIAIASDEPLQTSIRQFRLDDIVDLSNIIETEIIIPQRTRISAYINNVPIKFDALQREMIINTLAAIAFSIKGKNKIESIDISLRRLINLDR